jgi:glucose-1-phosphate thymidylyltransferase
MSMKGIILAGGTGSRLYPLTLPVTKQLLPIYDKPLIYYPLSVLMMSGIKEILIICTKEDLPQFQNLLKDGSDLGICIEYKVQEKPAGIAQAFLIGESFIGNDNVTLILGDNIFYGEGLPHQISSHFDNKGAGVFGYYVKDPERYGVATFNEQGIVTNIEEKPKQPQSNYAVTGLYIYDNQVVDIAKALKPSARGELEITDVNIEYMKLNQLKMTVMGRGVAWLDTGTHDSLLEASQFVQTIEKRQGLKIACIEEIAFRMGFIDRKQLEKLGRILEKSDYGKYILNLLTESTLPVMAS